MSKQTLTLPDDQIDARDDAAEALTPDQTFLRELGKRVREIRDRRGMTRKLVASQAQVSERHLAHLESGEGNVSIVLLRHIATALGVSLVELLTSEGEDTVERRLILLKRRLEDRDAPLRIVRTGRGRFRVEVRRPVRLELRDNNRAG